MLAMRWMARGEIELPDHLRWLSVGERSQVATIRFTKRRQEYLTRRWTAKQAIALALELGEPTPDVLASIEVRNHPSGAPWVAVGGVAAAVEISITDRAGWAVCLIGGPGRTEPLGIDLELVEPRSDRFIEDYLTQAEQRYVLSQPPGDMRDAAANLMWSAKEAALKVRQEGLRADTRTVEVSPGSVDAGGVSSGWAPLSIAGRDDDRMHGWWRRDGSFVLTLAARSPFDPPDRLPGSAELADASPLHSWVRTPLAPGAGGAAPQ